MADTLMHLWRIAIYKTDGESLGDLVGYKSDDGDITDYEPNIMYFNSKEDAMKEIDNSDEQETGMREIPEQIVMDMIDFMTLQ